MTAQVRIKFMPDDAEEAAAFEALLDTSEELSTERTLRPGVEPLALDPLSWALIIGGVSALTAVVLDYLERRQGGMIVDLTKTPAEVKRSRDVLPNNALILLTDGTVRFDQIDTGSSVAKKIFSEILSLTVGATAEQVKGIIEGKGGEATIEA